MADDDTGFLGRWSRRKVLAKQGEPLPEPAPTTAEPAPAAMPPSPRQAAPLPVGAASLPNAQAPVARHAQDLPPEARTGAPANEPADPAPARQWTMDDVRSLTPESDFSPFVARDVAPEVRNAALKKLFADPQFNVMDGLDIYIDDYSQPNPMPADWARKMVSAQFMNLFKDEPAPGESQAPNDAMAQAAPPSDAGLPPDTASAPSQTLPLPDGPGTETLAPPVVPPVAVAEASAPSLNEPAGPAPAADPRP
jgi:hypothetical protein